MTKSSIVVVGSSNTDMVVKTERFPVPGETVLGGDFFMNPGGKGANQAVAAARLGGNVVFICKVGDDLFGSQSLELFRREGINTTHILSDGNIPSGVALITVDAFAENSIVVAPGANAALNPGDIRKKSEVITNAAFVLIQLEIPMDTVSYVIRTASENGVKVVLNPAPAGVLPEDLYRHVSILTPNEKEASMLSGVTVKNLETAKEAAGIIHNKGVHVVIVTMGSKGALVSSDGRFVHVPAPVVKAVDTTAAGDVFNGALVVALSEGKELVAAVEFACKASAVSVTKKGAQLSAPVRDEIKDLNLSLSKI
ncbi:ribokinase [Desertivirga xinjiangensis]|uniref:ribokinase n=1 Tax=Desertivirga xinjiangensis TaxID=539206 RepID=UPI00210E2F75|nr:ribokinase [Pedobacter xinjiangensis]